MNINFSDEKKRQVYDEYGSFGLYISEQAGEECVPVIMCLQSGWFKVRQSILCKNDHTQDMFIFIRIKTKGQVRVVT